MFTPIQATSNSIKRGPNSKHTNTCCFLLSSCISFRLNVVVYKNLKMIGAIVGSLINYFTQKYILKVHHRVIALDGWDYCFLSREDKVSNALLLFNNPWSPCEPLHHRLTNSAESEAHYNRDDAWYPKIFIQVFFFTLILNSRNLQRLSQWSL